MPKTLNYKEISITSSPQTVTIPLLRSQESFTDAADVLRNFPSPVEGYVITGTHTLAGNVTVSPDSGAQKDMEVRFIYRAELTTDDAGGKAFSIFGFKFTDEQALQNAEVICKYNGSSWDVIYEPDFQESGTVAERHLQEECISESKFQDDSVPERAFQDASIPTAAFKNRSVTQDILGLQSVGEGEMQDNSVSQRTVIDRIVSNAKLTAMPTGTVKVGGVADAPTDVQMNDPGPGSMLLAQGYGNAPAPKQMIGMGTLDKDGVFGVVPGAITTPYLGTYAVTPEEADDTMVSDIVTVEVDITDGSSNEVMMGFRGRVLTIYATVKGAIVGNGAITANNDDDIAMVNGVITLVDGHPVDQSYTVNPTENNEFEKFDILKFVVTGSTGGKLRLSVIVVKQ